MSEQSDLTSLVVPDPRSQPVPKGWWEDVAAPLIDQAKSWDELDEAESELQRYVGLVEAMGGDVVEFEKALRVVEKRRGELLGDRERGRPPKNSPPMDNFQEQDIPNASKHRYRQIARWWKRLLYRHVLGAQTRSEVRQSALLREIAKQQNRSAHERIVGNATAESFGRLYDVIVIDPPWPIEKIERDVREFQADALDYPTLSVDAIAAMTLPTRADCHTWLWTTQRFLPAAFDILKSWHLKYVCTFVWHKPGGFQPVELPQYNCEFALYARRGSPKFLTTKGLKTCFEAKRGRHSEKPEAFYEMVRDCTEGEQDQKGRWNRLDMFNRRAIEGFERWGHEAAA